MICSRWEKRAVNLLGFPINFVTRPGTHEFHTLHSFFFSFVNVYSLQLFFSRFTCHVLDGFHSPYLLWVIAMRHLCAGDAIRIDSRFPYLSRCLVYVPHSFLAVLHNWMPLYRQLRWSSLVLPFFFLGRLPLVFYKEMMKIQVDFWLFDHSFSRHAA